PPVGPALAPWFFPPPAKPPGPGAGHPPCPPRRSDPRSHAPTRHRAGPGGGRRSVGSRHRLTELGASLLQREGRQPGQTIAHPHTSARHIILYRLRTSQLFPSLAMRSCDRSDVLWPAWYSVNDVVLAAVAGASGAVWRGRAESTDRPAVPGLGRWQAGAYGLGSMVSDSQVGGHRAPGRSYGRRPAV